MYFCMMPEQNKTKDLFGGKRNVPFSVNVPELVHPREGGNGSIPNVSGMINLAVLHFHFCIFQPERDISVVYI